MPPKKKTRQPVEISSVEDQPKKLKTVKSDDEPGIEENWPQVLQKALTVKQNKTLIKSLGSHAEEAVEQISVNELRHALWSPTFIIVPEGHKFCARAFPKIGIRSAHYLIKKAALESTATKQTMSSYGELLAVAWKTFHKDDEAICKEIENEMIKGLFDDSIAIQDPYNEKFMQMLLAFKNATLTIKAKMDNMLYECSSVVLWRGCNAVNNKSRYRACKVLLEFFPFRPNDAAELAALTDKQYDMCQSFLLDPCVEIRRESAYKVLKICSKFWEYIPSYRKRNFLTVICDKLAFDADVSVRIAVLEGLAHMVVESTCLNAAVAALQAVCNGAITDRNDRVRIQAFQLLKKLIPNRFIKYWDIVEMETIMGILEIETSESVKKEIIKLVFKSFYQKDENANDMLKRLNHLSRFGRNAALTFYKLIVPLELISIEDAADHLIFIGTAISKMIKGKFNGNAKTFDDTVGTLSTTISEIKLDEDHPKWDRAKTMMDCAVVLYISLHQNPKFDNFPTIRAKLEQFMTTIFKRMFQGFNNTTALGTVMMLGSLLPFKSVKKGDILENLVEGILQRLNVETDNDVVRPFLEAIVNWQPEELIKIISDGLLVLSTNLAIESPAKKKSKRTNTQLTPFERLSKALYYLEYIISSHAAKVIFVRNHIHELDGFYKSLQDINDVIVNRFANGLNSYLSDNIIFEAYVMKQTLVGILLNTPKRDRSKNDQLFYIKDICKEIRWFEENCLPCMKRFEEDSAKADFFIKMSMTFLRKIGDILMVYDFASVPSVSRAPTFIQDMNTSTTEADEIVELDFVSSFQRVVRAFLSNDTPTNLTPYICIAARQLLRLNLDKTELPVTTLIFVKDLLVFRFEEDDQLEDKQIGEQLFQLLKAILGVPNFYEKTFFQDIVGNLIFILHYIIRDADNCADPRETQFEVPKTVEVLLYQVIKRHAGIFEVFLDQLGAKCSSASLVTPSIDEDEKCIKTLESYALERIGACAQLVHLSLIDQDRLGAKKKINPQHKESVDAMLNILQRRVEQLEKSAQEDSIDNLMLGQVKVLFTN